VKTKRKYPLIPFDVIQSAVAGDSTRIKAVLQHYERYIIKLSLRPCRNNNGEIHMTVDPEVLCRVKSKLIAKILKFKIY